MYDPFQLQDRVSVHYPPPPPRPQKVYSPLATNVNNSCLSTKFSSSAKKKGENCLEGTEQKNQKKRMEEGKLAMEKWMKMRRKTARRQLHENKFVDHENNAVSMIKNRNKRDVGLKNKYAGTCEYVHWV